jgi:hypothetical protein
MSSKDSYLLALHQEKHRHFDADDDYIEDMRIDIIEAKPLAVDDNHCILVWMDNAATATQTTLTHAF